MAVALAAPCLPIPGHMDDDSVGLPNEQSLGIATRINPVDLLLAAQVRLFLNSIELPVLTLAYRSWAASLLSIIEANITV